MLIDVKNLFVENEKELTDFWYIHRWLINLTKNIYNKITLLFNCYQTKNANVQNDADNFENDKVWEIQGINLFRIHLF